MKTAILSAILLAAAAVSASAQSAANIPRTADGHPDFSGTWQSGGVSLYGEVEGNTQSTAAIPRAPRPATPRARPEPLLYQPWAEAKVKAAQPTLAVDDPTAHCLLPGVPRIFGMPMPFDIVQTPSEVVILYESFHGWRRIPIGGKHDDPDPSFLGDSIGSWDGDTLVVDVAGFNGKIWLDGRGHFTTDKLHVVERYKLNGGTISYDALVDDPGVMVKPWTQHYTFTRLKPGLHALEYECLENNQDTPHIEATKK